MIARRFFLLQLIYQDNMCCRFDQKLYFFAYNSAKNANFNFSKNPSFNHELYSPTNRKYSVFCFQIKLSWVILTTARILFSKSSLKTRFQQQNFQKISMKILRNIVQMLLIYMVKSFNKIILLLYFLKKIQKIFFFLTFETHVTP